MMGPDAGDVIARLQRWVASDPVLPGAFDPATAAFCRRKLRELTVTSVLAAKLERELGTRSWQPLGRVLLVIAEHDVLGAVAGLIAAHVTGNRVRIKARETRALLTEVVRVLAIEDCEILDWDSREQDDRAALDGIDGVLLAGGEDLIRHYRRVTPPGVRLIEFGPKLGCAAIASPGSAAARSNATRCGMSIGRGELDRLGQLDRLGDALAHDVMLFGQGVCSSPQWILVEDLATARQLAETVLARANAWPVLPEAARLLQLVRGKELALLARLGEPITVELDARSGWGVTIGSSLAASRRLPKGFAFVVGPLGEQLASLARMYPHHLQTLGTWGAVPEAVAFTHRCPIGRMHDRLSLEPHDGILELAALVRFTSREERA